MMQNTQGHYGLRTNWGARPKSSQRNIRRSCLLIKLCCFTLLLMEPHKTRKIRSNLSSIFHANAEKELLKKKKKGRWNLQLSKIILTKHGWHASKSACTTYIRDHQRRGRKKCLVIKIWQFIKKNLKRPIYCVPCCAWPKLLKPNEPVVWAGWTDWKGVESEGWRREEKKI